MHSELRENTHPILNDLQHQQFKQDGFLVLKDFLSKENCESLKEEALQLIDEFNPEKIKTMFSTKNQVHRNKKYFLDSGEDIRFFFEENALDAEGNLTVEKNLAINKFGHALHDLNAIFSCFSRQEKIAKLSNKLASDPVIIQSMYICKQPRIGGEVNCHQDATYLFAEKEPVIGLWFAIEDATLENGCLWAIPGGHKEKLKSRMIREEDTTRLEIYDDAPWDLNKMIPLEVPQGSVILLDGLAPHMSKENKSPRSRHAYTLHIMSRNNKFAENNWLRKQNYTGF